MRAKRVSVQGSSILICTTHLSNQKVLLAFLVIQYTNYLIGPLVMHYQTIISRWIKFRLPLKNISASWRWVQTISEDSIILTAPETTWKKWMSISYNIVKEEFFVIMTNGLFAFNRQIRCSFGETFRLILYIVSLNIPE